MRLRTLLLGSTAAIFVGGAATTASAADPVGLVVATMQNQTAYVPLCNGDDGFQLNGWCFVPTGEVEWTAEVGWETNRFFNALPNSPDGNINMPTIIVREEVDPLFDMDWELELEIDNGYVEFVLPIEGGTLELTIGNFEFTANGVTWTREIGDAEVAFRLRETDTLGWRDNLRFGALTAGGTRNWFGPTPHIPDFEIDVDLGNIDFAINVGYRGLRPPGFNDDWFITANDGTVFTTVGGEMNFDFDIGDAVTLTGGADFDRAMVPEITAIVAGDNAAGRDLVEYNLMWAWGANLGVEVEAGPATFELHGYYGRNFGGYTMYTYEYQPAGHYWAVEANAGLEFGPAELTVEATITDGPQQAFEALAAAGVTNPDRVLALEIGLEITPENMDDITFNFGVELEKQLYDLPAFAPGFRILTFTGGATWEPADDVEVEFLLTHTRPVADWGGTAGTGVPAATKFETTVTVGF